MAKLEVCLPDDLAAEVATAGLNISQVTQEALRKVLSGGRLAEWLDDLNDIEPAGTTSEEVPKAVTEGKRDLWGDV